MKFLQEVKKLSLATIIVSAVLGILFIAFPSRSIKYLSLIVGIGLIAIGIAAVVSYCIDKRAKFTLVLGVIVLICGIVICAKYREIINLIVMIFGIFILASGIVDLVTGLKAAVISRASGITTVVLSVISIIFGIVAITKSAALTDGIIQFIGVALIVYTVVDAVTYFEVKNLFGSVKKAVDDVGDIETDATIVEENDE